MGVSDRQYQILLMFRQAMRHYLRWSAQQAEQLGLTPQQHQLLLAVRGHPGGPPSVGDTAEHLMVRHHSAVELIGRVERLSMLRREPDPHDSRVVRLRLTARGAEVLEAISRTQLRELQRMAATLGVSEDLLGRLSAEFVEQLVREANNSQASG